MNEEIICKVCGEINKAGSNFCSSCGAAISKESERDDLSKNNNVSNLTDSSKNNKASKKKSAKGFSAEAKPKILSNKKLSYLIIALVLIGAVVLFSSGMFDFPTATAISQDEQTNQVNPHAGVDLNSLNQITELEKTVRNNPNDKETLLQLAHLLNDSGFKDKAVERYHDYLKLDPKNADVWVDMGVCYYDTKHNDEAISAMEKALQIQPRHQIANLNLGIVNMSSGNKDKAESYWKKSIEINPTNEIGQKAKELLNSH